jgi:uncharacterized protein YdaU (DUF1376 family)
LIPKPKRVNPSPAVVSFQGFKKRASMHYYQFNIGDYKSHTEHLSEMEDLTYRRLLDWYYLHEVAIPLDIIEVARQIRMRSHSDCIATVLHEYFDRTANGWIHHRADVEIARVGDKSQKASRSAKSRWEKEKDANALQTQSEGNATQDTVHKTQDTKHKEKKQRGSRLPADFEMPKAWEEFAEQERPDLGPRKVFESFKDYWTAKPGAGGVKLDWFATWRNWIRNQAAQKNVSTFSQIKADVAKVTVTENPDFEATKRRVEAEASIQRNGPTLAVLERMAAIRKQSGGSQ